MNIVFNKKTLKVLSLFDNNILSNSEQNVLRSMFPNDFNNISLWSINKNIKHNLMGLTVKLDKNSFPDSLLYKGKTIYSATSEDKKKILDKIQKEKDKILSKILPRNLRSSVGTDIIKMWQKFPYTKPYSLGSLSDLTYFTEEKIIPALWWGNFMDAGGYGNMNRSILFRLHNYHVMAKADILPTLSQISSMGQYYVSKYTTFNFRRLRGFPKICGFGPQPHQSHVGKTVFFTMMETETLHPTFRDLCNTYSDEVWVPSSHNKKVFEEGGIKKPVVLMPLGIDEIIYKNAHIAPPKNLNNTVLCDILGKPLSQGVNSFKFFTLFGWSFRKGIDILIKSFVKAFDSSDDVCLIVFSNHVGPDQVVNDTIKYAKMIRSSNYPQILFIPGVTPELEMPSLYKIGNAFINTSRGEGFSLPQIEAAACGLPVISCNNTGMGQYLRDDNAFLIKTEEKEPCRPEMHWISHYYHGQLFPKLGEDQINQAAKHMHFVVNNYNEALGKAKVLQKEVWENYTWDKAVERIANRIKQIS